MSLTHSAGGGDIVNVNRKCSLNGSKRGLLGQRWWSSVCVMNSATVEGGRIVISKVKILTDNVPADGRRYLYASLPTSGHGWSGWSMCRITIRGVAIQ